MATKAEIKELQTELNAAGYTDDAGRPLVVDGIMGPRTRQAIAKRDAAAPAAAPAAGTPAPAGQTDDEKIVALAMTQHGGVLAPFVQNPEIRNLLGRYVRGEIDENTLTGLVMQTNIWQTTNASQRQWQTLETTDPATVASRIQAQATTLVATAREKGIVLAPSRAETLAKESLRNGWNEQQINDALEGDFVYSSAQLQGQAADFRSQVENLASSYFVPMSEDTKAAYVTRMVSGEIDAGFVDSQMRQYAKSLFPTLADAIDKGITVAQYADPYKQVAARTLGVNPATIDFTDPKWGKALMAVDPKTGQRRAMNLDEWTQTLRNDERYGWRNTKNAQDESAALVLNLAKTMGRR
ncbi:MAG: peptidoglycan-binding protein [Actinomycetota bacterium]